MSSKKTKKKRNIFRIALLGTLLGANGIGYLKHPTYLSFCYYTLTDPFINTPTEKRIEEQFGIDYEGDPNEDNQRILEKNLQTINETNPELLTHCEKIVLYSETVYDSPLVKPFLNNAGYAAGSIGTLEVIENSVGLIAHELAHLAHYDAPKEFDDRLDKIFADSYQKEPISFVDNIAFWKDDGTYGPRNGFVSPYGTINSHENVATYVARAYNPSFWQDERLKQLDKYLQTLSLLSEYHFISPKQFEEIKSAFSTSISTGGESTISFRLEKAGSENRPERSEHAAGLLTSSGLFSLTKH